MTPEEKQTVGNLLAVIHRDGGHYFTRHGLVKACEDGEEEWRKLIVRCENLEHENKQLREAAEEAINSSIPYLARYNSFMISPEAWNMLAYIIDPVVEKLDALFNRAQKGDRITEAEIRAAFNSGEKND